MSVSVQRRLFSVEEYYKMAETGILSPDDRVELIGGEIIRISPIKSYHAAVVSELTTLLTIALQGKAIVRSQNPVRISPHSEPEPDITVARLSPDRYRRQHPAPADVLLLVEVSDSSLTFDIKKKLPLYAQALIPEVWIVNLQVGEITQYSSPQNGSYTEKHIFTRGNHLDAPQFGIRISLSELLPPQ